MCRALSGSADCSAGTRRCRRAATTTSTGPRIRPIRPLLARRLCRPPGPGGGSRRRIPPATGGHQAPKRPTRRRAPASGRPRRGSVELTPSNGDERPDRAGERWVARGPDGAPASRSRRTTGAGPATGTRDGTEDEGTEGGRKGARYGLLRWRAVRPASTLSAGGPERRGRSARLKRCPRPSRAPSARPPARGCPTASARRPSRSLPRPRWSPGRRCAPSPASRGARRPGRRSAPPTRR